MYIYTRVVMVTLSLYDTHYATSVKRNRILKSFYIYNYVFKIRFNKLSVHAAVQLAVCNHY